MVIILWIDGLQAYLTEDLCSLCIPKGGHYDSYVKLLEIKKNKHNYICWRKKVSCNDSVKDVSMDGKI